MAKMCCRAILGNVYILLKNNEFRGVRYLKCPKMMKTHPNNIIWSLINIIWSTSPAIKKNCDRYHFLLQKCSKNVRKCSKMLNFMKISWYLSQKCKILWEISKNSCYRAQSRFGTLQKRMCQLRSRSELGGVSITKDVSAIYQNCSLFVDYWLYLFSQVETRKTDS